LQPAVQRWQLRYKSAVEAFKIAKDKVTNALQKAATAKDTEIQALNPTMAAKFAELPGNTPD
jgi:hypothetical protein